MGADLLLDPHRVSDILKALRRNMPDEVAVTCKIRLLEDKGKMMQLLKAIENSGVSALAVHCRTPAELRYRACPARWKQFYEVKEYSNFKLPFILNGDILDEDKYQDMCEQLPNHEDGVMVARGAMFNPSIFQSIKSAIARKKYLSDNPNLSEDSNAPELIPLEDRFKVAGKMLDCCIKSGSCDYDAFWYTRMILFGREKKRGDAIQPILKNCQQDMSLLCERLDGHCQKFALDDAMRKCYKSDITLKATALNMKHPKENDIYEIIEKCQFHDLKDDGKLRAYPPLAKSPYNCKPTKECRILTGTKLCPNNSSYGFALRRDLQHVRNLAKQKKETLTVFDAHFLQFCLSALAGGAKYLITCKDCKVIDKDWLVGDFRRDSRNDRNYSWYCQKCFEKHSDVVSTNVNLKDDAAADIVPIDDEIERAAGHVEIVPDETPPHSMEVDVEKNLNKAASFSLGNNNSANSIHRSPSFKRSRSGNNRSTNINTQIDNNVYSAQPVEPSAKLQALLPKKAPKPNKPVPINPNRKNNDNENQNSKKQKYNNEFDNHGNKIEQFENLSTEDILLLQQVVNPVMSTKVVNPVMSTNDRSDKPPKPTKSPPKNI